MKQTFEARSSNSCKTHQHFKGISRRLKRITGRVTTNLSNQTRKTDYLQVTETSIVDLFSWHRCKLLCEVFYYLQSVTRFRSTESARSLFFFSIKHFLQASATSSSKDCRMLKILVSMDKYSFSTFERNYY